MKRTKAIALLALLAMVAVACGGRLDEQQIQAEMAADGFTGGGVGPGGAAGATDEFGNLIEGSTDGALGSDATGGSAGRGNSDTGVAVGGGPGSAPGAPEGGNGGATDVGVTETEILIGNVATLSGPVPGLFAGALRGTQAAFEYQNSLGGLFGRRFKVASGDDQFDAGKNRQAHANLKDKVFGFVGSFSLFDGTGASEIEASGAVDVGRALSPRRQDLPTHISPFPFGIGWPTTGCDYLKQRFGEEAIKKMAFYWGNADVARDNYNWQKAACESRGFVFVEGRELQATESNFAADVQRMRAADVQGVMIVFDVTGIARFFKSLHQQRFDPPIKYPSPAAYDSEFIKLTGADAVEGLIIGQNVAMYSGEDAGAVPEIKLFNDWLAKIDPNQKIDIFAMYGWASGRLLVEAMKKAGPQVTRQGVLDVLKGIHSWNNFGMSETLDIGSKKPGPCEMYMEVKGGRFQRVHPASGFHCDGTFVNYPG